MIEVDLLYEWSELTKFACDNIRLLRRTARLLDNKFVGGRVRQVSNDARVALSGPLKPAESLIALQATHAGLWIRKTS